jgi:hypothetical protein
MASALVKRVPDWENGWVYQANSLRGLNPMPVSLFL